jgi:hypothetical protein
VKKFLAGLIALFLMQSLCFAQQDSVQVAKEQALGKIRVAADLKQKANELLGSEITREKLITASQLYLQAGQLFEQAGNILKALGAEFASSDDVQNCDQAARSCVEAIKNIRSILQGQKVPPP